jgi:penicillin-binding protein 2
MEKYLNDTLQEKSKADLERIANSNLIPAHYKIIQWITDSTRAQEWFKKTKDSSYIKRFLSFDKRSENINTPAILANEGGRDKKEIPVLPEYKQEVAILPEKKYYTKPIFLTTA